MTGRIETFRTAVINRIKVIAPALKTAEPQFGRFDLDELERTSLRCPAVRLSILKAPLKAEHNSQITAELHCVAFVITDGKDKDQAGWAIAEAIASELHPGQLWGLVKLGGPERAEIQPVVSGQLRDRGVSIIAVEWQQSLRHLGLDIFDETGVLLSELYVNGEEIALPSVADGGAGE